MIEDSTQLTRRSVLSVSGSTIVAAGPTIQASAGERPTMATVDLGNQGLSNGDVIDSYLQRYFVSGNEVRIPEGSYTWNGGGFPGSSGRGTGISNASLIGDGNVSLRHSDGANVEWSWQIGSGDVELRNITIRGVNGGNKTNYRFDCHSSSSTLRIDNFNLLDGASGGRGTGIFIGTNNSGTAEITNCEIRGMTDNGIRVCRGRAVIDGCHLVDVDIDAIRAGGRTTIRNTVIEMNTNAVRSGRGIRVGGGCTSAGNVSIENCDLSFTASGAERVLVILQGSGEVRNCRIRNDGGNQTIDLRTGGWSGSGNHHTGSQPIGDAAGWFSCSGSGCDPPNLEGADPFEGEEFALMAGADSELSYSFTVTGEVRKTRINSNVFAGANDTITGVPEGTRVEGFTANAHGDAYLMTGEFVDLQTEGPVALHWNREHVERHELPGLEQPPQEPPDDPEPPQEPPDDSGGGIDAATAGAALILGGFIVSTDD